MITKMSILQTTAYSADVLNYPENAAETMVKWMRSDQDIYKTAADLFEYVIANPTASVKDAFIKFYGREPFVTHKTKKSRVWSSGKVFIHEQEDKMESGGVVNSFQQLAERYKDYK